MDYSRPTLSPDRHAMQRASTHLVSENASATEAAQLLVVFVADALAQLTANEKQ
jgi:hypothetical protein